MNQWQKLGISGLLAALMAACNGISSQDTPTSAQSPSLEGRAQFVEGEVIVRFRENVLAPASLNLAGAALTLERDLSGGETLYTFSGNITQQNSQGVGVLDLVQRLEARADVEFAQPNYLYYPMAVPNDANYASQWHYPAINLPQAWDLTTGAGSPVIAVIDTGKTNHPDLSARWVGGYDFISSRSAAKDGNGRDSDATDVGDGGICSGYNYPNSWHGTHVAGTVGASSNNGVGVAGVNWNARILPVRVLGKCGGSTADIIDAIRWSAGLSVSGVPANVNPAKVINMSLGGSLSTGQTCATHDVATQNAINAVTALGANVVVAAGNSNKDTKTYTPASCNNTVTVASLNRANARAYYSNYGPDVDIAAPGGDTQTDTNGNGVKDDGVLSTLLNSTGSSYTYQYYQGTSMAAPHVAGVVSLMLARDPSLTPAQILSKLKNTATPLLSGQCPQGCGSGLVNALAAVQ
jgi:serine protease